MTTLLVYDDGVAAAVRPPRSTPNSTKSPKRSSIIFTSARLPSLPKLKLIIKSSPTAPKRYVPVPFSFLFPRVSSSFPLPCSFPFSSDLGWTASNPLSFVLLECMRADPVQHGRPPAVDSRLHRQSAGLQAEASSEEGGDPEDVLGLIGVVVSCSVTIRSRSCNSFQSSAPLPFRLIIHTRFQFSFPLALRTFPASCSFPLRTFHVLLDFPFSSSFSLVFHPLESTIHESFTSLHTKLPAADRRDASRPVGPGATREIKVRICVYSRKV
jgi:hypothetical protein